MSTILPKSSNPKARKPYTVRYWADGAQRERSFVTLAEAKAFRTDADHATRYGNPVDSKAARQDFTVACAAYIERLAGAERSKILYRGMLAKWVGPALAGMSVAQVAGNRDAVAGLLTGGMAHLSLSRREAARAIIVGTLNEAVAAGTISQHRAAGIRLADNSPVDRDDFVFPTFRQVEAVAVSAGLSVWLMRGLGLRIQEALGVEKADFRDHGRTLHLAGQANLDGTARVALKHRRPGEGRDIPVPTWLWNKVKALPDGPLCPGRDGLRYAKYSQVADRFSRSAKAAGIVGHFTPHSLRHCFASALLAADVPITDLARWLGHRDINQTFQTYSHLIPSAAGRAASVLDSEYETWTAEEADAAA